MLEVEALHEPTKCSARSWSAAVLCRYANATRGRKRQRTAALQDADALTRVPFQFMVPMRGCWAVEVFHEPRSRASSPLRADGCNHDFLQGAGRRAPVLRSTNAKRGHQPSATEGGRRDAPYPGQPVQGPNA